MSADPHIAYDELRSRLHDRRLQVVNVLSREAYRESRIPGSISLPVGDVRLHAAEVLPDPNQEIAVYCGSPT